MKSKDKTKNKLKISLKNILYFLAIIVIVLYACLFYNFYFGKNKSYAKEVEAEPEQVKISNAQKIQIDDILQNNIEQGKKEEFIVEEIELEYITKYRNNKDRRRERIRI